MILFASCSNRFICLNRTTPNLWIMPVNMEIDRILKKYVVLSKYLHLYFQEFLKGALNKCAFFYFSIVD